MHARASFLCRCETLRSTWSQQQQHGPIVSKPPQAPCLWGVGVERGWGGAGTRWASSESSVVSLAVGASRSTSRKLSFHG
ncbi:unnamed protein product [Merluccius merluccius]